VTSYLAEDLSRPTTLKQRYRARGKTLLRVSHLRQHEIDETLVKNFYNEFKTKVAKADLVVFSDFNYGCLPQRLVEQILDICRERHIPMVADSQSSSQTGDISRFKGMQLITPTEREARLALRDSHSGLVVVANHLRQKAEARNVVVTLGSEGVLIRSHLDEEHELHTDQLPALNLVPKDVSGAGDSLLIASSMALATGADIWSAMYLGSLAAACQVGRVGNTPLTPEDLLCEMRSGPGALQ
jgi:rfaE bifunctional protein kinase chain/domain